MCQIQAYYLLGRGECEKSAYIITMEFEEINPTKITKVAVAYSSNHVAELDGIDWIDDLSTTKTQRDFLIDEVV